MRAFVTGATGFLGSRLTEALNARGDDVVALDRSTSPLSDRNALRKAMQGCDAVFHLAAVYKVGVPRSERGRMFETNVRGTENVIDAAWDVNVPRIVYVSTVNVFGNTHGNVVDETYERRGVDWLSAYDWTKYEAHQAAKDRIERGAPVVIAQPGAIYGPGDHSELGAQLDQARNGKLRFKALADVGVNAVHVDDVVAGLLLLHAHGRIGESYVLGGADHDARRDDRPRLAEARPRDDADPAAQGDDPGRAADREGDGYGAEPPRADHGVRRRHLLGDRWEGAERAGIRAAQPGGRPETRMGSSGMVE